jgi:3-phenylpropionate/cinnamic acid dioxygenase small subunit
MDTSQLVAIEEIRALKGRYCRLCDTRDWDGLFSLFAKDAVFGAPEADNSDAGDISQAFKVGYADGLEQIEGIFRGMAESIGEMVHQAFMPEIEVTSADTARGKWGLEDLFWYSEGPVKRFHGYGHYHDTYVRDGGVWLIKSALVTRLRLEIVMAHETVTV